MVDVSRSLSNSVPFLVTYCIDGSAKTLALFNPLEVEDVVNSSAADTDSLPPLPLLISSIEDIYMV